MVNEGREVGSAGLRKTKKVCRPFYERYIICHLRDVY